MSSWRDSDDPRCPACGEKITATASYCMHCEADFAPDGSVLEDSSSEPAVSDSPADDDSEWEAATAPDTDSSTPADQQSSTTSRSATGDTSRSGAVDTGQSGDGTARPSADVSSSDDYDPDTGRTGGSQSGTIEKTSLLLRAPIAVLMGLPAGIMLMFAILFVVGSLSGEEASFILLASWAGTTAYLLRKPLASDAIGDAFYIYAGLLLAAPLLSFLGSLAVDLGGGVSGGSIAGGLLAVVFIELFLAFPAAFLLLVGYGCNYYARTRIEEMLNESRAGG